MAAVTLVQVAQHAGVSLATASRVLNGSARVPTAGIALRVRASAEELGYVPNAQAQALARSATGLVGLVVHDIGDPYFSTITRGAQRAADARRSQLLLAGAERNEQAELQAVSTFVAYRTDAIILAGSRRAEPDDLLATELSRYTRNGGRVVTFGSSSIPDARLLRIGHREAAARLVTALLARGVSDFAILAGPPELSTARDRVAGYQEALADAGLSPLLVLHGEFGREGGLDRAQQCWEQLGAEHRARRVCLLAVNDVMALGAITGLRELGLSVPDDVQVAGFDDIPPLRDFRPALTTVRLPLELIGERAVELALAPSAEPALEIAGEPVLRDSAG
jgi:LacI family transcriptional regulator